MVHVVGEYATLGNHVTQQGCDLEIVPPVPDALKVVAQALEFVNAERAQVTEVVANALDLELLWRGDREGSKGSSHVGGQFSLSITHHVYFLRSKHSTDTTE